MAEADWGSVGSEENTKARATKLLRESEKVVEEIEREIERGEWRKAVSGYERLLASISLQRRAASIAAEIITGADRRTVPDE